MTTPLCPNCGSDDILFSPKKNNFTCENCGTKFDKPTEKNPPLRVFLSYGHDENAVLVKQIKRDIESKGHEVWLDLNEIKFGDDWRQSITDGIMKSNLMFSFLSRYSTREPGVCLDELSIALGVKSGIIQTILVENEQEVTPPVSVSHIQWLDMHDWKAHWEFTLNAPLADGWYDQKIAEIVGVVESDNNRHFAGEIEELKKKLRPLSPDARIGYLLKNGFEGRQWLVQDINNWRQQNLNSRIFLLTGEPGVGKSAFAAWLAHHNKANIIAAHFIEYNKPDQSRPARIIMSIAFQMASRLPDYRKFLLGLPEIDQIDEKNVAELFANLLVEPLSHALHGNRERYVVLIDALDEASEESSNSLVDIISREGQKLPDWITFVITSRPNPGILRSLSHLQPLELKADEERNRLDLSEFIRTWMKGRQITTAEPESVIGKIVTASEGNFLYLRQFCEGVENGWIDLLNAERYPKGMTGLYQGYFRRQFPDIDAYEMLQAPLLELVVAAFEPLSEMLAEQIIGWDGRKRIKVLDSLGSLFQRQDGRIAPFHKSMKDWLTDPDSSGADYHIPLEGGHKRLAEQGWTEYKNGVTNLNFYFISYLASHLKQAKRFEDLLTLLSDSEFLTRAWRYDSLAVLRHWMYLEDEGYGSLTAANHPIIDNPSSYDAQIVNDVAELLRDASYPQEEMVLRGYLLSSSKLHDEPPQIIQALINLGKCERYVGNNTEALQHYLEAKELAQQSNNDQMLASSYFEIGDLYRQLAMYKNAEDILVPAVTLFGNKRNWRELVKATLKLERVYNEESKYQEAIDLGIKYLNFAKADGIVEAEASMHLLLCRAYSAIKDKDNSSVHLEEGLHILNDIPDAEANKEILRLKGKFLIRRGIMLRENNDYISGLRMAETAYSLFEQIGDFKLMKSAVLGQAQYYRQLWDLTRYLELSERQLSIAKRAGNLVGIKSSMHNVGFAHQLNGEYEDALRRYQECLDISKNPGFRSTTTRGNMADIHRLLGNLEEAILIYKELLDEAIANTNSDRIARSQRYLNVTYMLTGNLGVSKSYAIQYRDYVREKHKSHLRPPNGFAFFLVHEALICAEEDNFPSGNLIVQQLLGDYPDLHTSEEMDLIDTVTDIARYFILRGDLDKAELALSQTKGYWERYNKDRDHAWHLITFALLRYQQHRYDEALEAGYASHTVYERDNLCRQAESALLLARIHLNRGDFANSTFFLDQAEEKFRKYKQPHKVAETVVVRGQLLLAETGDSVGALALVRNGRDVLTEIGWLRLAKWANQVETGILS